MNSHKKNASGKAGELREGWDMVAIRQNRQVKRGRGGNISQLTQVADVTPTICKYCRQPFWNSNPAKRLYCTPDTERKLFWERKEALILLVSDLFTAQGCTARNMDYVARLCVEAEHDNVYLAVRRLGWRYGEDKKRWDLREEYADYVV